MPKDKPDLGTLSSYLLDTTLANSRFHHKPDPAHRPNSKLEAAYHKADKAIENIVDLLAAA
jgi:hypothetical protein